MYCEEGGNGAGPASDRWAVEDGSQHRLIRKGTDRFWVWVRLADGSVYYGCSRTQFEEHGICKGRVPS